MPVYHSTFTEEAAQWVEVHGTCMYCGEPVDVRRRVGYPGEIMAHLRCLEDARQWAIDHHRDSGIGQRASLIGKELVHRDGNARNYDVSNVEVRDVAPEGE